MPTRCAKKRGAPWWPPAAAEPRTAGACLASARLLLLLLLTLARPGELPAQSAVRYRDASGQWVFTDQGRPAGSPDTQELNLAHDEPRGLSIGLERTDLADATRFTARNGCLCPVLVRLVFASSALADVPAGAVYLATLAPGAEALVLEASADPQHSLRYRWSATLGSPQAQHHPPRPYRPPFAAGASFRVSQAYPTHITHVGADSRFAIDIAMPDGTPVYTAREGLVINVRHDAFLGAPDPALLDQANVVEILHDDGTVGVYAHLHWDSIRVRIGQRLERGEYLADSGNTGFTSGPHLHFAVWRNSPVGEQSVPLEFAGAGGTALTVATGDELTAY